MEYSEHNVEPESPDSPPALSDRLVPAATHGCVYLFAIAIVGLCGALAMGLFAHNIRQWGWFAGALTAAIGYPLGWVTFPGFKLHKQTNEEQEADARMSRQTMDPVGGSLAGIAMGIILGILVWFLIMVFWLSLALSPFTPDSWRVGMAVGLFNVQPPAIPALLILAWSIGVMVCFGVLLGLCGKMYRHGPSELKAGKVRKNP